MSLFKYGNFEKELDFSDPDFLDLIDEANARMKKKSQESPSTGKQSDITRRQVQIIDEFFDDVLGVGASEKMFDTKSALKRTEAFTQLQSAQNVDVEKMNAAKSMWTPNRENRRHQNKNRR